MRTIALRGVAALCALTLVHSANAAGPNRPVITEVFQNPAGTSDGPVGRLGTNAHQEYIEIYLPEPADLRPGLNADALNVTFYEVEGDDTSSGNGLVNYRIDLPTFDLNPSNGLTPGAIARPSSGIVVVGWVDYAGAPPFDLAGTSASRIALINGGVTTVSGFTFIAMNGGQFSGTSNFPVPLAVSDIALPNEASSGIIQNGSGAYLLVNRDDPAYAELYDDAAIPIGGSANPSLPSGLVLGVSALFDAFACNDHGKFDVMEQPYDAPTGDDIDLEFVLPLGGAFSRLVPQIDASGDGYSRKFLDIAKTTEDATTLNDNPITDALNAYHSVTQTGPFFPTPGRAAFTTSAAELAVADASVQVFDTLAGSIGRPGVRCANLGGNQVIEAVATPGVSSNPAVATFAVSDSDQASGQSAMFPRIEVAAPATAAHNATANASVSVTASNVSGASPPVVNPVSASGVTIRALNPTRGLSAAGTPFQATVFAALQGLPNEPGVPNEFANTSLAGFVAANLGGIVDDERHNGQLLTNPLTNLSDPILIDVMEDDMPDSELLYINRLSPAGLDSLVTTVLNSADMLGGNESYADNFNASNTLVKAVELTIDETRTSGGTFIPTERVHFVNAGGLAGLPDSGLSHATSQRGFEFALVDSNVEQFGTLESGETDDFGIVVEVGRTRAGASVTTGEFVFLSFTGGYEGEDIDSLNTPPYANQTVIIYLDLDNLDTVLGCETITRMFVIDGSGGNAVNIIEAFSLNVDLACACKGDANQDGTLDSRDIAAFIAQLTSPGDPATDPFACAADLNNNGLVGIDDVQAFVGALVTNTTCP
ncbi:MAG TPA: hypothetical protein P5081_08785 [Phycisphaerae bacterium]|nr:hypothetical protein [Phycisphaerae bacterium]HRW52970.1 hypothetical protein [Phycisphaerae bacterium]